MQTTQTKTIGNITVTLHEVTKAGEIVGLRYSYEIDHPTLGENDLLAFGAPKLKHLDGKVTRLHEHVNVNENTEIFKFKPHSTSTGIEDQSGNTIDAHVGWYVIPRHDVSSTANIAVGPSYASAMKDEETYIEVDLAADLTAGDRTYQVAKLFADKGMGFGLIIVPANNEAKNFALGSVGPMEVTLTDNLGTSFLFNGSSTGTVEAASGIEVASQQFNFLGELDPAATSLKLTIEGGGGEVVGPFVFDGIELAPIETPQ